MSVTELTSELDALETQLLAKRQALEDAVLAGLLSEVDRLAEALRVSRVEAEQARLAADHAQVERDAFLEKANQNNQDFARACAYANAAQQGIAEADRQWRAARHAVEEARVRLRKLTPTY